MPDRGDLTTWLAWLRIPDCVCLWEWRPCVVHPGGWVKVRAHPDCPYHGTAAGAADITSRRQA